MNLQWLRVVTTLVWLIPFGAPGPSIHAAEPPILIGATLSLTGKYQDPAKMMQNASRLWARQVNARGGLLGRPVRLIIYDDQSDPDRVAMLYERLITQDGVDLVLSPYGTPLTLRATEVTERHEKVMMAAAAAGRSIWERRHRYVFGVYALADRYFIGQLDLMARHGLKSVYIFYEDSPFNRDAAAGAAEWAERFGVRVIKSVAFVDGSKELPGLMANMPESTDHGLIFSAYPPDVYRFLKLMQSGGRRPAAVGMTIAPIHPDFIKRAGPIGEGVFSPSQWEPDERIPFPGTRKFITDFRAFSGNLPSYHAGSAYAACGILEDAVNATGAIDHEQLREVIVALDTVTIIGRFKVDHTGKQIGHNPMLIQWQNGKKQIVYPLKMQTAPAVFSFSQ